MAVLYQKPDRWIKYDRNQVWPALTEARVAVQALTSLPYRKSWAQRLQAIQLKREVAGTSRIEGAEFTERELDFALSASSSQEALNLSQRQAKAAVEAYRWISQLESDRPITLALVQEVHRLIVTGCDDDHCPPGLLRGSEQNVAFGIPRHRGVEGGKATLDAMSGLVTAVASEFRVHHEFLQALALHYHIGAMHPFLDGNGRTARALEALFLQRAGLKDELFIALSNYYYDNKSAYLDKLSETAAGAHDLTPFLLFGLKGIKQQCERLTNEIKREVLKSLYREVMYDLFTRLKSPKKRVIAKRQLEILKLLLAEDSAEISIVYEKAFKHYAKYKDPARTFIRDLGALLGLDAVRLSAEKGKPQRVSINLDWATQITEEAFFELIREMPRAKQSISLS